jgi:hypothetical protein
MEAFVLEMGREVLFKIVIPAQLVSKDLIGAEGELNFEQGGEYAT